MHLTIFLLGFWKVINGSVVSFKRLKLTFSPVLFSVVQAETPQLGSGRKGHFQAKTNDKAVMKPKTQARFPFIVLRSLFRCLLSTKSIRHIICQTAWCLPFHLFNMPAFFLSFPRCFNAFSTPAHTTIMTTFPRKWLRPQLERSSTGTSQKTRNNWDDIHLHYSTPQERGTRVPPLVFGDVVPTVWHLASISPRLCVCVMNTDNHLYTEYTLSVWLTVSLTFLYHLIENFTKQTKLAPTQPSFGQSYLKHHNSVILGPTGDNCHL